jgi:phosphatidylserine/phosphatidylglycerophosphate/cardiolipin synthase-like enzyme
MRRTRLGGSLALPACYTGQMRLVAVAVVSIALGGCEGNGPGAGPVKPPAGAEDGVAVWFSPGGGAMAAVIDQINHATKSIDVLAYLITDRQFVDALRRACQRGVRVRVILDKNGIGGTYAAFAFFRDGLVPLWRDGRHDGMHDKVILIDGRTIITGSFNFTTQADQANVENLLIIRDRPALYAAYEANFEQHLSHSERW